MQQQSQDHQRSVTASSTMSRHRPKSGFLSWVLINNKNLPLPSVSSARNSNLISSIDDHHLKAKLEIPGDVDGVKSYEYTEYACATNANCDNSTTAIFSTETIANPQQIQTPGRRQSHLHNTSYESEKGREKKSTTLFEYNHKAYCAAQHSSSHHAMDGSPNNSTSLARSATWQPSSSSLPPPPPVPPHDNLFALSTATENMIPTRRTSRNYSENPEIQAKLNAVLNSEKAVYLSSVIHNNTSMCRRSTTPKSRKV
ncbi:hypothetical protein BD408DRAFT_417801 [Parasitella parasitica]|nr:hypothetical protein BD408DRAFT_417801 [Parasitella parasitica]